MPLRGLTIHGILYIKCSENETEGHAEMTLSQTGDQFFLILHREGEPLLESQASLAEAKLMAEIIGAMLKRLPEAPIQSLSPVGEEIVLPLIDTLAAD
jgi:hypothetical protein